MVRYDSKQGQQLFWKQLIFKKIAFVKTKYPWSQSPLELYAFYYHILCVTTLEYRTIGGRGFENVLKINNQKGWNNFWGFKNRTHVYFD